MSMESSYIEKIYNIETGEIVDVEQQYTKEQLAEKERDLAEYAARQEAKKLILDKRNALLEKLGITEEEAKLLLG